MGEQFEEGQQYGSDQLPPGRPPSPAPTGPSATAAPVAWAAAPPGTAPRPAEPRRIWRIPLAAAVIGAVVGGAAGAGAYAAIDGSNRSSRSVTAAHRAASSAGSSNVIIGSGTAGGTVASAAAGIAPSVVTINVAGAQAAGTGSGVIIRPNGYILTNDHVVTLDGSQPATTTRISVTLDTGRQLSAKVVGADAIDDLAIVKINRSGLRAATFADSSKLVVGQPVVAVGAPLGLSDTVTAGIVSALDRPVQAGNSGQAIFDAVQTDAAINPGNSGGPLVNLAGQVVGIDAAIASADSSGSGQSGNIGIGFAIPSEEASRIANELIATGHATHPIIGVEVRSALGGTSLTPTSGKGATVVSVTAGGPGAKAGLRSGDVITAVGRQRIDDSTGLIAAVRSYRPGQTVTLTVERNGSASQIKVKLGSQPD